LPTLTINYLIPLFKQACWKCNNIT